MSKVVKSLGGSTSSGYSIDPAKIVIYGYDVEAPEDSNMVETDKARLKVDKAMAKNIAARGVIQPVQCRIIENEIVVVNGRRRIINARAANEMRIEEGHEPLPVRFVLEQGGDSPDAQLTMAAANHFAKGHGPMAQADKARAMLNAGLNEVDVANSMGFSKATLYNRLKLLELPKHTQNLVASSDVSIMAALELVGLEPDEANSIADQIASEGGGKKGQTGKVRKKKVKDGEEVPNKPPTRSQLMKTLETEEIAAVSEEVQRVLRWVVGDLRTPNTIDGLAAAFRVATNKKKAAPRPGE